MFMPSTARSAPSARRHGFTLIELLIVLCIIGIVAAILLPIFTLARDKVHTTACAANLHQIGMAVQLYVNDHNRFYPRLETIPENCTWVDRVAPYAKSNAIFECPASDYGVYRSACSLPATTTGGRAHSNGSYLMIYLYMGNRTLLHASRLTHPADTLLVVEGRNGGASAGIGNGLSPLDEAALTTLGVESRHRGQSNVLFVDGHIKSLGPQDLTQKRLWLLSRAR